MMSPQQRIAVNMTAQYTRSLVSVLLALYSTRLLLLALGQTDFGIYSVVAGVIALLSFVTNALVTSTQRYLSYYCNQSDAAMQRTVFASSLLLHLIIGLALLACLLALTSPVIRHLLVIDAARMHAATVVYIVSAVTLLLNFLCAPFRAAFVAHENIVYISIVDIIDAVLRLVIAVVLLRYHSDRLILYAILLMGISVLNILLIGGYSLYRFAETRALSPKHVMRSTLLNISSFIGWSMYSSVCILFRTQGLAVIINRAFGTVANAAYGIAQQVINAVAFLYTAIFNAMNPQLMRAEGNGERQKMISIALAECKVAYLVMLAVCVPLVAEMPEVLHLWLGDVPPYAVLLCRMVLVGCLIDQLTLGLNSANQATGKIASYSLLVNTTKAITIPVAWWLAVRGADISVLAICYIGFEALCALLRIPHLRFSAGISVRRYMREVALPLAVPTLLVCVAAWLMRYAGEASLWRLLLTLVATTAVWAAATWLLALSANERQTLLNIFHRQ